METPAREWVCLNGRLMSADQAHVSVFDSGFMQGIGLFETMRAYNGRVFRIETHLDRLLNSARALGWTVAPDRDALRDAVTRVAEATEAADARVRLTVTTGSLRAEAADTPQLTIVANASPGAKYPPEFYTRGATLVVSRYRQSAADPTAGHKTTSYFPRLASLREAHARSALEALWLTPDGHVAEGAISTVFVVENGELLTPPLETPVLPGITRSVMIELARRLGVAVHERALALEELRGADEAFLTNCLMELMPVVRVDSGAIGNEKPGDLTRELATAYGELISRECGDG